MSNPNTGHGHVWARPDGVKARCGGPGICSVCSADKASWAVDHPDLAASFAAEDALAALTAEQERLGLYEQPAAPASTCGLTECSGKPMCPRCLSWKASAAAPSVAPEPVAWTLQSELDAAQTTCSAHLWFTNPRNSAWTALFTREKIAAHPPRAPLTRREIESVMTEHYPLDCLLRENVDAFEACVRDLEAAHGISAEK